MSLLKNIGNLASMFASVSVHSSSQRHRDENHSPISIIPPDALEIIFFHVVDSAHVKASNFRVTMFPTLTITSVCQLWRSVALDSARLWTKVCLTFPTLALRYLHLSQLAPLKVSWYSISPDAEREICVVEEVFVQLQPHTKRIQRLQIEAPTGIILHVLNGLEKDLPALEVCHINDTSGPRQSEIISSSYRVWGVTIPISFNAPRLRELAFAKVRLNLVDLTSILSAVADVLEHLRLDTVAISREDSEESTAEPDNEPGIAAIVPPPRIHLSRLKTCRFSRCDAATLVLNAVRFPITTQVELVLDSSSSDATTKITPDTQELLRSCFQHTALGWNQRGIRSTSTISELDGSDKGLSIEGATINTPHVGIILCRSLVDWSSIVFLEFGGNLKKIVQSYPPRGPPQQCRMDYADYPFETWYSVFDSLPALTTLVVYDDQVTGIQNMMEVLYAPEPRCCPNLRSLTMVGWDFDFKVTVKDIQTIRETGGPNDIRGSSIAIFLYYINMVIQSRKDTGIPLDELRFKRCRLHKTTTNLFKALFADLKVIAEV